jgi:heavy metal sensor kinase
VNGTPYFQYAFGIGHHEKIRVLNLAAGNGSVLRVGITVQDDQRVVDQARRTISFIMIAVVGIAVIVGWLLAKRALIGVQNVTSTANAISRSELQRRVPTSGSGDEIDQLANTFNRMLERIETLVKSMEETNDNIAHELRSPIARIRGQAETTLTGDGALDEYREMAANTVEECDRLLTMINTMLDIAEAEAGVMSLKMTSVDVRALLRDICEIYEPMTAEKNIRVLIEEPGSLAARGDVQRLQRMIANLLDNAVKYTPKGGTIRLSARQRDGQVEMSVENTGEGIVPEKLPHIFQRFYRADASRAGTGSGLGLSLAQAIVRAHGGQISVHSIPGDTTTFSVVLPATN